MKKGSRFHRVICNGPLNLDLFLEIGQFFEIFKFEKTFHRTCFTKIRKLFATKVILIFFFLKVLMPAWLYTLGRLFTDATNIHIPFTRLLMNLFTTIGPCLFGLALSKCFPKLKSIVLKIAKPSLLIFLLCFLSFTIYVKYYIFALVNWKQWATAPFVPWLGFLLGATFASIARLPMKQVVTIALETGIQNVGVGFLVITYNFPSPESDYAILPLISVSFLTTIPLWFLFLGLTIKRKIQAKKKQKSIEFIDDHEMNNETLLKENQINNEKNIDTL
jgi:predicted Na+-dependent transporter